mmetsp:Transcript_6182/g.12969  ORF Transcript_6182/g.12969 Transcript_6182/m.12969 type:complete len:211 (-) Transcript_6182:243-875(-)
MAFSRAPLFKKASTAAWMPLRCGMLIATAWVDCRRFLASLDSAEEEEDGRSAAAISAAEAAAISRASVVSSRSEMGISKAAAVMAFPLQSLVLVQLWARERATFARAVSTQGPFAETTVRQAARRATKGWSLNVHENCRSSKACGCTMSSLRRAQDNTEVSRRSLSSPSPPPTPPPTPADAAASDDAGSRPAASSARMSTPMNRNRGKSD